jgi:hypothetical protein
VDVIFGLPDWILEDIKNNIVYCCTRVRYGAGRYGLGRVRCIAMRGARVVDADMYPCIDGAGRPYVLNRDGGLGIERLRPLVCLGRGRRGGKVEYEKLERRYGEMVEMARRARAACRKYCVIDEYGYILIEGDDIYEVVDRWAKIMSRQTLIAVLV